MRLLFLSNLYPPYDLGGLEQLCQEVTNCLRDRGHTIKILTSNFGKQLLDDTRTNNVIRSLHLENDLNNYRPTDFFLKRWFFEWANKKELQRAINQFVPDMIVVWGMWNLSYNLPYWAEKWMPGRVMYYIASYWPLDLDLHRAYWRLPARRPVTELIKRPLRALVNYLLTAEGYPPKLQLKNVMCCSNFVRDRLIEAGKVTSNARVLFSGTDPTHFVSKNDQSENSEEKQLKLLYFGRLIHDKGVHTAIKALGLLKQRGFGSRLSLTILGDGHPEYKLYLHNLVKQLDITDQVHFPGRVSRDEIPKVLQNFDVFLFTSIWPEPFGRTIVEAMLAGLVVIGSDVGGSREILTDYNEELLFPPEDFQGLADRIVRVTEDPLLRNQLVEQGQQLVTERFSLKQMVDKLEEYLFEVLSENNLIPA